jgi:hypothetical protein
MRGATRGEQRSAMTPLAPAKTATSGFQIHCGPPDKYSWSGLHTDVRTVSAQEGRVVALVRTHSEKPSVQVGPLGCDSGKLASARGHRQASVFKLHRRRRPFTAWRHRRREGGEVGTRVHRGRNQQGVYGHSGLLDRRVASRLAARRSQRDVVANKTLEGAGGARRRALPGAVRLVRLQLGLGDDLYSGRLLAGGARQARRCRSANDRGLGVRRVGGLRAGIPGTSSAESTGRRRSLRKPAAVPRNPQQRLSPEPILEVLLERSVDRMPRLRRSDPRNLARRPRVTPRRST